LHLPGFLNDADAYRAKGIDDIICITVNDPYVAVAWKHSTGAEGKVRIFADINAELTKAMGVDLDVSEFLGSAQGLRCKRFSALIVDSIVQILSVEPDSLTMGCSSSDKLLQKL
jgi:peroxiredoxin